MMTRDDAEKFDSFLSDSFGGEIGIRELRLSKEEVEYLTRKYPKASMEKIKDNKCKDGKKWYAVSV